MNKNHVTVIRYDDDVGVKGLLLTGRNGTKRRKQDFLLHLVIYSLLLKRGIEASKVLGLLGKASGTK